MGLLRHYRHVRSDKVGRQGGEGQRMGLEKVTKRENIPSQTMQSRPVGQALSGPLKGGTARCCAFFQ